MPRIRFSLVAAVAAGLCGAIGCDDPVKPAESAPEIFLGKWVGFGYNVVKGIGYERNDTMHVELTIEEKAYSLYRDYAQMTSTTEPWPDTIIEKGNWSKKGTDSLVLTPTECIRWDNIEAKMQPGDPNPPVRLKIAISGTTWNMDMQNIQKYDTTTAVVLHKQ